MGLLKKKNKKGTVNPQTENNKSTTDNVEVLELNKKENVEVLDLEKNNEKVENTLFIRKENRLLFIIVALLILFVIFLPTITRFVNRNSIFSYSNAVEEIVNNRTVDGMLEIGKEEGSITVKEIRFYNPNKRGNNEISIVYLPETGIKNVNNMNIYIEIYNSNKNVIYREKFTVDNKLERKVQGTYTLNVGSTLYKEAAYAKVTLIKEEELKKPASTLICTKSFTDENYKVEYKTTYNFSSKGLVNYQVNKAYKITDDEEVDTNKYKDLFQSEYEELEKTNIEKLEIDETLLIYTIDLTTLDLGKSKYAPSYRLGSVPRQIKLGEEKDKWSCK